ncbi:MAG: Fe-S cluster assembly protein SufD [Gammaproteobacteria bacterium]
MRLSNEQANAAVAAVEQAHRARRAADPLPAWLAPLQETALAAFGRAGFPSPRHEDWKYTNLAELAKSGGELLNAPTPVADRTAAAALLARLPRRDGDLALVIANGRFAPELSILPKDDASITPITIRTLADAQASDPQASDAQASERVASWIAADADDESLGLVALNAAFLQDWVTIDIAADANLDQTIHVIFTTDGAPAGTQPRVLVTAGSNSACTVFEHHVGDGAGWTNAVTHLRLEEAAELTYIKLQSEGPDAHHIAAQFVSTAADSRFRAAHIDLGGGLVRNDLRVRMQGRGSRIDLFGLFLADGKRHIDNHTRIDHLVGDTTSRERYHGILADRGRGVFNGKIIVHEGADGTDAELNNRNLLLSKMAEIDTKPELEIYTDDVKCAHGATTGQLDEQALFYLRSRGVSLREAKHMLVLAFARDVLEKFDAQAPELLEFTNDILERRLPE